MNLRRDAMTSLAALGSCVTGIFISVCVSFADTTNQTGNVQSSSLRIVWNYPDMSCQLNKIDLELSKYGIITNHPRSFVGNEVATLYSSKCGIWPDFEKHNLSMPINGGLPQLANLTAHLEELRKSVARQIPEGSTGYGVIDQEVWRTLYGLNYGYYRIFQWASVAEAGRKHGTNNRKERDRLAEEEWDKSAREFMEQSLLEARAVRPDTHWGYYLYPQRWWTDAQTQDINDRMAWLFKASTGLYPSIYIKNLKSPKSDMKKHVESTLNEAIRVRALHGQANTPIVAYTAVQAGHFFSEEFLDYAIGLPAEMGIEGVIIWGSSGLFKPDPRGKCNGIKKYVRDVLGPYVSQLTERFTDCSISRCGGRGRCVRSDYAQSTADILKKAGLKRQAGLVSVDDNLEEIDLRHDGYQLGMGASSRGNIKRFSNWSNRKQISTWNRPREELSMSKKSLGDNRYNRTNQALHSFKTALSRALTRQTEPVNNGHSGIVPSNQKSNANPRNGFTVQYTGHSLRDKLIDVYAHYLNLTHTRNYTINLRIDQSKSPDLKATQMNVNNYELFHNESSAGGSQMSKPRLTVQADKSHWSTGDLAPDRSVKVVTANHHVSNVDPPRTEPRQPGQAHAPVEVNRRASGQYDNYACQCYSQWKGPFCEDSTVV